MTNLENKSCATAVQRGLLLDELKKTSYELSIFSSDLRGLRANLSGWIALNLTTLMQVVGINNRKIATLKRKNVILNIGCAGSINNSYINADLFPNLGEMLKILTGKYKIQYDLFVNLTYTDRKLTAFADGIVLSHVLEHIPLNLAIPSLKNCFAYLKQGGCIRISVPHLDGCEQPSSSLYQKAQNILAKNTLIYGHGHKFMYEPALLSFMMQEAGFSDVKEVAFQQGLLGESDEPFRQRESIYLTGLKA